MFDILKMILLIVNPLLLAFAASVLIGVTLKRSDSILMIKRIVSLMVFGISFILYSYLVFIVKGLAMCLAMFLPLALVLIFIIVSVIVAPKGEIKEDMKKDYKTTGWFSMFPNDIDNK